MKTYALVGRSGTGKSFRAQYVARKYRIPLIIDDGLLIKGEKILAGKSAKQDPNFITALKTALFYEQTHYESVKNALEHERFRKILIIGTSDKMVSKIAERLGLNEPSIIIRIEDIATVDEIETAMRIRYTEGKHVIPVPPIQVTRSYSSIVYDSIKVAIKKGFLLFFKKQHTNENTLVKPEFTQLVEKSKISEAAIAQMITQCLYDYKIKIKVEKVTFTTSDIGYTLNVLLRSPVEIPLNEQISLKEYISDSLEKYGGIFIDKINLTIEYWAQIS